MLNTDQIDSGWKYSLQHQVLKCNRVIDVNRHFLKNTDPRVVAAARKAIKYNQMWIDRFVHGNFEAEFFFIEGDYETN